MGYEAHIEFRLLSLKTALWIYYVYFLIIYITRKLQMIKSFKFLV